MWLHGTVADEVQVRNTRLSRHAEPRKTALGRPELHR